MRRKMAGKDKSAGEIPRHGGQARLRGQAPLRKPTCRDDRVGLNWKFAKRNGKRAFLPEQEFFERPPYEPHPARGG